MPSGGIMPGGMPPGIIGPLFAIIRWAAQGLVGAFPA